MSIDYSNIISSAQVDSWRTIYGSAVAAIQCKGWTCAT